MTSTEVMITRDDTPQQRLARGRGRQPPARLRSGLLLFALAAVGVSACTAPRPEHTDPPPAERGKAKPASAKSDVAPPLKTTLSRTDRERWRQIAAWPEECESAFQASVASSDAGLVFHELADGRFLLQVLCAAGAYQPSHVFLSLDERAAPPVAALLKLPIYQSEDGRSIARTMEAEIFGEPTWLPDSRELTILSLARQTGDCGVWTKYRFTAQDDAVRPAVVEARALLPCPARLRDRAVSIQGQPPNGWKPIRH